MICVIVHNPKYVLINTINPLTLERYREQYNILQYDKSTKL